jgi:hypothetical protein
MSILEFHMRPLVEFDVDIKEHRKIFNEFLKTMSWGHNPYRFIVPDMEQFDLVTAIERKMLAHYLDREFGKPLPVATSRKDVLQMKKLVDKQTKR